MLLSPCSVSRFTCMLICSSTVCKWLLPFTLLQLPCGDNSALFRDSMPTYICTHSEQLSCVAMERMRVYDSSPARVPAIVGRNSRGRARRLVDSCSAMLTSSAVYGALQLSHGGVARFRRIYICKLWMDPFALLPHQTRDQLQPHFPYACATCLT